MSASPSLAEALCWEIRRSFRELSSAADRELSILGITVSDRALLEHLAREREPISLSELARQRSVSRQHIHQSLKRLRNPKWIELRPDPTDARQVLLRLSPTGTLFWEKVRKLDKGFFARMATCLNASEAQKTAETLRKLRAWLGQKADESHG